MMTRIYSGKRQSGKTTEMIKQSAETGAVIVTPTSIAADYIKRMALDMMFDIPKPISINRFIFEQYSGTAHDKRYLIDELQTVLTYLNVEAATTNSDSIYVIDSKKNVDERDIFARGYNQGVR